MINLKKSTELTMIAVSYLFVTRTVASIFPRLFASPAITAVNMVLSLIASVMPLLFFYFFYKEYFPAGHQLSKKSKMLKNSSVFAFIGSLGVALIFLKGFFLLAGPLFRSSNYGYFDVIAPWVSSVFALFFYFAFYRSEIGRVGDKLIKAAFIAIVGAALALIIRSYLLFEFSVHGNFSWFWNLTRGNLTVFLPLYIFMFFAGFYFLWCLYRELGNKENN